jgi:hypothetical protein
MKSTWNLQAKMILMMIFLREVRVSSLIPKCSLGKLSGDTLEPFVFLARHRKKELKDGV